MIWGLISTIFAQELEGEGITQLPQKPKGIECSFTEPFLTIRYDFETQTKSIVGYEYLQLSQEFLKQQETHNPFIPQYQLVDKKTNTPDLTIYVNNNGSNGMSEIGNPIDAHFGGIYGGCSFVDKFGTHIVYGTETDDEPWLNLRSKGSMKGEIIGRLDNGTEVNILYTRGKWYQVEVVNERINERKGWVSSKYIKRRTAESISSPTTITDKSITDDYAGGEVGIECHTIDSPLIFRYYFEDHTFLSFDQTGLVEITTAQIQKKDTENPLVPKNLLYVKGQNNPYQIIFDNRNWNAFPPNQTPLSLSYLNAKGKEEQGYCFFRYRQGTHIVVHTYQEEESEPDTQIKQSTSSKDISKLPVGTELLFSFEGRDWIQAYVVYPEEISISRKIDRKYIRKLQPDPPATMVEQKYNIPKRLNDNGLSSKIILERIREEKWGPPVGGTGEGWETWLGKEQLYPIGWSKDGHFAYLIHGGDEAYYCRFLIVNSTSNTILFRKDGSDEPLEEFWSVHYDEIQQQLNQHQIVQQSNFELDRRTHLLPKITLKTHPIEKNLPVLKGTIGFLKNPYGSSAVTVDYYFYHDGGRGEGGTDFDVTAIEFIQDTKTE